MKILERFFDKKNEYKAPINPDEIDWSKIDLEKANFILQEGEKRMRTVLANNDSLDNKIALLRTFLVAFWSTIFGILKFGDSTYQGILIFLIIVFSLALITLCLAYEAVNTSSIGTSPEELLKAKYNSEDLRFLICSQLQTYSIRIANVKKINASKGRSINIVLIIISISLALISILLGVDYYSTFTFKCFWYRNHQEPLEVAVGFLNLLT